MQVARLGPWLERSALLLGAFLLFSIQPLIGRALLPSHGGGAGVWLGVMVFSQLVLMAGYAYAHGLMARRAPSGGTWIHAGLLGLAILELGWPVLAHGAPWMPVKGMPGAALAEPSLAIVVMLALLAGLPLVALSATAPLVQALHARTRGDEPYRLYALSNAGSLGGLLAQPLLLERGLGLTAQAYLLAGLFLLHGALMLLLFWRARAMAPTVAQAPPERATEAPPVRQWLPWLGLSCLGTLWLMAISNWVATDIGSIPLIWVLPLGIYLLTFILAFDAPKVIAGAIPSLALGLILALFAFHLAEGTLLPSMAYFCANRAPGLASVLTRAHGSLQLEALPGVGVMLVGLFAGGLLAHGRLERLKPEPRHLTWFYLHLSMGRCLGGVAISLGAPHLFNQNHELPLVVLATALVLVMTAGPRLQPWLRWSQLGLGALAASFALVRLATMLTDHQGSYARDFYGMVEVGRPIPSLLTLVHGRTVHGLQYVRTPLRPAAYYGEASGIGQVLRTLQKERPVLRVGVMGLGVGNVAGYGRAGDTYTFYEISPKIIDLAGPNGRTYNVLRSTPARVEVVPGDGRLSLEGRRGDPFDVLLIDAFAGGHIPPHLLTREALRAYLRVLSPEGLLVFHVSHHLPLWVQVGANVRDAGLFGLYVTSPEVQGQTKAGGRYPVEFFAQYWITSRSSRSAFRPGFLESALAAVTPEGGEGEAPVHVSGAGRLGFPSSLSFQPWTDERNSLTPLLFSRLPATDQAPAPPR